MRVLSIAATVILAVLAATSASAAPDVSLIPVQGSQQSRVFTIYFGPNQDQVNAAAEKVLEQSFIFGSGGTSRLRSTARFVVVGYSDSSGSPQANLDLSQRRAKAVADELVGSGVPEVVLSVAWKGSADPAVPTAEGVAEPNNNRVTVSVSY